jgi:hypothetical protein
MKWLVSFLLAVCAASAQESPVSLLPPGTKIVFGIDVHAVMDSALARTLSAEIHDATADLHSMLPGAEFAAVREIKDVLLASTGEGENPGVLIIARGSFDTGKLADHGKPYHGILLLAGTQKNDGAFAFLNDTTVLAGDPAEVKAAIDRRTTAATLDPAVIAKIQDLQSHYAIWGFADHPEKLAKRLPSSTQQPGLQSLDRFQFGVNLAEGLAVDAALHVASPEDARQLGGYVKLLDALMKGDSSLKDGAKLHVEEQEGTLQLALSIPEEELKRALQQRLHPAPKSVHVEGITPVKEPAPPKTQRAAAPPAEGGTTVFTLPGPKQ